MDRERETRRAGWRLMRGTLGSQRAWLVLGVIAGVSWTAAKISVPLLAAGAIDNGILPGDSQAILEYSLVIVAVGVVQAVVDGVPPLRRVRHRVRGPRPTCACGSFAHLQRLHFAFHDQAQTGQLMAHANTDIQQINNVVHADPAHDREHRSSIVGVVIVMVLAEPGARVVRARRAAAAQHRRDAVLSQRMYPVGIAAAGGARRPVGRGRGERHRRSAS